jgi:hypothetical protein
MKVYIISNYGI